MIDWVSVEELDCSAESQVLIPAEHLWCDFKYRPCMYVYVCISLSLSLSLSLSFVAEMEQKQAIWCLKRKSL